MAKRPISHVIDDQAQIKFMQSLPPEWTHNILNKDYGIDYIVTVFKDGCLTPLEFTAQLKGAQSAKISRGSMIVKIKTERLKDYLNSHRSVFIIRADISSGKVCYLFAQQYILEKLKNWRSKKSINIKIPLSNLVSSHAELYNAIVEADKYVAALHPQAIPTAIAAAQKRLANLDDRFEPKISIIDGVTHYRIDAKQLLPVTIQTDDKKLYDLIARGVPTTFSPEEFSLGDSPLLAEVGKNGIVAQIKNSKSATLNIYCCTSSSEQLAISHIPVTLEHGTLEFRLHGGLPHDLIKLRLTVSLTSDGAHTTDSNFEICLNSWVNKPYRLLPYFDDIFRYIRLMTTAEIVKFAYYIEGNYLTEATAPADYLKDADAISDQLRVLHQVREVARVMQIFPIYTKLPTHEEMKGIEMAHFILSADSPKRHAPNSVYRATITREGLMALLKKEDLEKPGNLEYEVLTTDKSFLGVPCDLFSACGKIQNIITNMRCSISNDQGHALISSNIPEPFEISWRGTDETYQIIRKEKCLPLHTVDV